MTLSIYHNPRCSKSRQTLQLVRDQGTEPEIIDDRYTGNVRGVPCFQHGKVEKLGDWLKANNVDLEDSCFYSDSHNDLPLLKQVARPVAVDPDDILHQHAVAHDWRIMSLRN